MSFEDLAPELQEKMKNCKTREEFDQLVKEAGIELSEEMLDALAGGMGPTAGRYQCPLRDYKRILHEQ